MQIISEAAPRRNTQEKSVNVIVGPHRIRNADWEVVRHLMAAHGYAAFRVGLDVLLYPADREEGIA